MDFSNIVQILISRVCLKITVVRLAENPGKSHFIIFSSFYYFTFLSAPNNFLCYCLISLSFFCLMPMSGLERGQFLYWTHQKKFVLQRRSLQMQYISSHSDKNKKLQIISNACFFRCISIFCTYPGGQWQKMSMTENLLVTDTYREGGWFVFRICFHFFLQHCCKLFFK